MSDADTKTEQPPKRLYYARIEFRIYEGLELVRSGSAVSFVATDTVDNARQEASLACFSELIAEDQAVLMKTTALHEISAEQAAAMQEYFACARPQAEIDAERASEASVEGKDD